MTWIYKSRTKIQEYFVSVRLHEFFFSEKCFTINVTDEATGKPIYNATVTVANETYSDYNDEPVKTTDENGMVSYCLDEGVTFNVSITHPDYEDLVKSISVTSTTTDQAYEMTATGKLKSWGLLKP